MRRHAVVRSQPRKHIHWATAPSSAGPDDDGGRAPQAIVGSPVRPTHTNQQLVAGLSSGDLSGVMAALGQLEIPLARRQGPGRLALAYAPRQCSSCPRVPTMATAKRRSSGCAILGATAGPTLAIAMGRQQVCGLLRCSWIGESLGSCYGKGGVAAVAGLNERRHASGQICGQVPFGGGVDEWRAW